jgi:lysophospholipase L1-like esterase
MDSPSQFNLRMTATAHALLILILFSGIQAAACGGKTPVQPPPPAPQLQLNCPQPIATEATTPLGAEVQFDPPSSTGGVPPHRVECAPGSGSVFPVGQTNVDCTASDAGMTKAACNFLVTIRVSERLKRTKFLAFGDSITEGQVSPAPSFTILQPFEAYPYKLEQMLHARYPAQDVVVLNRGWGGEETDEAVLRLAGVLNSDRPEVMLLLEGINGITRISTSSTARNLRRMVSTARQLQVDVLIATVMPVASSREARRPGTNARVRELNRRIGQIAAEFQLGAPVDLYTLFQTDLSLLGMDGLHPTATGYTQIAELFSEAIVQRYGERIQATH